VIQSGSPPPKLADAAAGTLPLLACIALSAVLMVVDHRGELSPRVRAALSLAVEPVWRLAALPGSLWRWADTTLARQQALAEETRLLRRELQLRDAQLARLEAVPRATSSWRCRWPASSMSTSTRGGSASVSTAAGPRAWRKARR
jgi:rod shape-determining protein MreC